MKAIPLQDNLLITWSRPKVYRAEFVLRFGKELVGRLCFELSDPAAATAEAEDGSWKFRYTHFLSSRVSIWTSNMNFLGALELPLSKPGEMDFLDGRQFKWAACDADQKRWQLSLEDNTPVLRFSQESTSWRSRGYVELTSSPMEIPDISLLCLLGCYLLNLDYSFQVSQALRRSMMDIW